MNIKIIKTLFSALVGMLALTSCHGSIDGPESAKRTYPNPTAVMLSVEGQTIADEITMYEGDEKTVKLSWAPSDAKALKYEAKIQSGKTNVDYEEIDDTSFRFIAKDDGSTKASVTVTFLTYEDGDGNTKTKKIAKSFNLSILKQKKDAPEVTSIDFLKDGETAGDTLLLKEGATAALTLETKPSDAIIRKIEFESSNDAVAVRQDSLGGWMIEGRKAGRGTLTANVTYVTSIDNKTGEEKTGTFSAEIPIWVLYDVEEATDAYITIDGKKTDKIVLNKGDVKALGIGYVPEDAVLTAKYFTSSNADVVSIDQSGTLTAKAEGEAEISATADFKSPYGGLTRLTAKISAEVKDLINFADPEVKKICVERWDKDGDGELSKYEAGLVKNIGYWDQNENLTSFDEMQYFTNLDTIPARAFLLCKNIKSIMIPTSVKYIGEYAFITSGNFYENASINGSSDTKVLNLNWDALEYIGGCAFACGDVTEIIFGKNVKYAGNQTTMGHNVRKITFKGNTPPRARLLTEYGTWDSVCGVTIVNESGEMMKGYEDFKIDIFVPSGSIEKYNKKYYYYNGKGYSNDEPTEDQIGYYVFDHTAGESLYFGDGKYYQDWYNNKIKWQYPILQDYKTEKPKKGVYYCYYMKEDQLTSNCGRVPFYNFIEY